MLHWQVLILQSVLLKKKLYKHTNSSKSIALFIQNLSGETSPIYTFANHIKSISSRSLRCAALKLSTINNPSITLRFTLKYIARGAKRQTPPRSLALRCAYIHLPVTFAIRRAIYQVQYCIVTLA